MRRPSTLLLALALVVAACSSSDRPPLERVSGRIGATDNGTPGPDATDSGGTTSTDGPAVATDGPAASGGSTGSTTATGSSGGSAASAAAATAALDAYLDALRAEDFKAAQRVSEGGPRFMATVRHVVSRYNREREGVTKLSYSVRNFEVSSNAATIVGFSGNATLEATTSGPAGKPRRESRTFTDPVVTLTDGTWRVADYEFDGAKVVHHPASSHEAVGGIDLRLLGGLSFGTSMALVIDLVSDADHTIRIDNERITYADGTTAEPTLGALISQKPAALYFLFDRASSPPTSWSATITVDKDTKNETRSDVVLRF